MSLVASFGCTLLLPIAGRLPADPPERSHAAPGTSTPSHNVNARADSLELKLELPREAESGSPIRAVLRLRNLTQRPISLYLRGRTFTVDVIALRRDGETVWRRLDGEIIPAMIRHQELVPGQAVVIPIAWKWSLGAGDYQLQALLLTEGEPLVSSRVPLRLR